MGVVLTINGVESNIGCSSVALTLGEKINYLTKKSVCIVELDNENPSFSYILEHTPTKIKNLDTVFTYVIDDTLSNEMKDKLKRIIESNSNTFKGTNISVIYGSKQKKKIEPSKINILLKLLKEMYDVVVIDYGKGALEQKVYDYTDVHLLICQPTVRYIDNLRRNRKTFINKKTTLLFNNTSIKSSTINNIVKEYLEDIDVIGYLPSSNTLVSALTNGLINVDKGAYGQRLFNIAAKVSKKLLLKIENKKRFSMFSKNSPKEDVSLKNIKSKPIGDILIEMGKCTKQDIDDALKIQAKSLKN